MIVTATIYGGLLFTFGFAFSTLAIKGGRLKEGVKMRKKQTHTHTHIHILVWDLCPINKKSVAKIPAHLPPEDRHAVEKHRLHHRDSAA